MRGIKSLTGGLLIGLIIAATVLGALVLSVRSGQSNLISELPVPTVTLQTTSASPTATQAVTPSPFVSSVTPLPSSTPTPTPTICPIPVDWQRYIVGPFDTLISIAQRFNLTPDQLMQANCLNTPSVSMGQTIYVPGFKPTPTTVPCFPPFNWIVYIVRPGDTLSSIAARYGISLYTLMRANCLSTTYIYYGQGLYVPPIYPIVTMSPTPIIPTFTPTPPIGTFTPTIPPTDTPTALPTTPAITVTPGPTDTPSPTATPGPTNTPGPTATSAPTDTPAPTNTLAATNPPAPSDTPVPTAIPTVPPLPTNAPDLLPTVTTAP